MQRYMFGFCVHILVPGPRKPTYTAVVYCSSHDIGSVYMRRFRLCVGTVWYTPCHKALMGHCAGVQLDLKQSQGYIYIYIYCIGVINIEIYKIAVSSGHSWIFLRATDGFSHEEIGSRDVGTHSSLNN